MWLVAPARAAEAAEASGDKWGIWMTVGRFFNLAVVVGFLVWVGRKPLMNFFANRSQSIRDQLAEAQQARKEAEAKLAEIEARLKNLDVELQQIKAAAEKEAQEEHQRLMVEAERDADRVIERARQEIDGMTRAAQQELKAHVADLSVRMAEEKIRAEITPQDHGRLFERFLARLREKR